MGMPGDCTDDTGSKPGLTGFPMLELSKNESRDGCTVHSKAGVASLTYSRHSCGGVLTCPLDVRLSSVASTFNLEKVASTQDPPVASTFTSLRYRSNPNIGSYSTFKTPGSSFVKMVAEGFSCPDHHVLHGITLCVFAGK